MYFVWQTMVQKLSNSGKQRMPKSTKLELISNFYQKRFLAQVGP